MQSHRPLTLSKFFQDVLQAPLKNVRWSWGAYDKSTDSVILRVWADDIETEQKKPKRVLVFSRDGTRDKTRPGYNERREHLELAGKGAKFFGVVGVKNGETGRKFATKEFYFAKLLEFGKIEIHEDRWYARISGEISIEEYVASHQSTVGQDIRDLEDDQTINETTRKRLCDARIGQGEFRKRMLKLWGGRCAVTRCDVDGILRASHAKPWKHSTKVERLNPHNGLPLIATLDALFDRGLIAFDAKGKMLVSRQLTEENRELLGIPRNTARPFTSDQQKYVEWHRKHVFETLENCRGSVVGSVQGE